MNITAAAETKSLKKVHTLKRKLAWKLGKINVETQL
jgi:hypothetical protein